MSLGQLSFATATARPRALVIDKGIVGEYAGAAGMQVFTVGVRMA
jgi:hypothetical protein